MSNLTRTRLQGNGELFRVSSRVLERESERRREREEVKNKERERPEEERRRGKRRKEIVGEGFCVPACVPTSLPNTAASLLNLLSVSSHPLSFAIVLKALIG